MTFVGEVLETPYGRGKVISVENNSIVLVPTSWRLAKGQKPFFHLNPNDAKTIFSPQTQVKTQYGVGHIVSIRTEDGVYIVTLENWHLATGKSPILYLQGETLELSSSSPTTQEVASVTEPVPVPVVVEEPVAVVTEEPVVEEPTPAVEQPATEEPVVAVEEPAPVVEEQPVVESAPIVEEPVVEEPAASVVESAPVVEEPTVEEQPVVAVTEEPTVTEEQPVVESAPVVEEPTVTEAQATAEPEPVVESSSAVVAEEQPATPVVEESTPTPTVTEEPVSTVSVTEVVTVETSKFTVGDKVVSMYGKGVVREIRTSTSIVVEPSTWVLANNKAPVFYLNSESTILEAEYNAKTETPAVTESKEENTSAPTSTEPAKKKGCIIS